MKPANFLLVAHDDPGVALPAGLDRLRLTPVAPFSRKPSEWLRLPWRNRFDGKPMALTTFEHGEPGKVRVKTYGDVVTDYRLHPDAKAAAADGGRVKRGTIGLLGQLPVRATGIRYAGKETARLAEEEAGTLRLGNEPFDEYEDRDEEWAEMVERVRDMRDLGLIPIQDIVDATGVAERTVQYWLNGRKVARNNMVREQLRRLAIKVDR